MQGNFSVKHPVNSGDRSLLNLPPPGVTPREDSLGRVASVVPPAIGRVCQDEIMPKALDMTTQISPAKPKVVTNTDMKQTEGQDHSTKNTSWFSVMWRNKTLRKHIFDFAERPEPDKRIEIQDESRKEIEECGNKVVEIFRKYDKHRCLPDFKRDNNEWLSSEKKKELKSELENFLLGADQKNVRSRISVGGLLPYDAESYLPVLIDVLLKIKTDQIHSVRLPHMRFKSGEILNQILAPDIVKGIVKRLGVDIDRLNNGGLDVISKMSNLKNLDLTLSSICGKISPAIESKSVTYFLYDDGRDLKLDGIGNFPELLEFDYFGTGINLTYDWEDRFVDFGWECKKKMPKIQKLRFMHDYLLRDVFRDDNFKKYFKEEMGYDIVFDCYV
ncbi:hypothetical protein [Paraburkholderia bonniea]|uniref:hypothetical protein n=1 Tax=Paraburkholderia bonniea TaxID=2152891 RepID=UPI001291634C|nr:hypothetical protein [Paraburkholderia bonniea]